MIVDALVSRLSREPSVWRHSVDCFALCKKVLDKTARGIGGVAPGHIAAAALLHDLGKTLWPPEWFEVPLYLIAPPDWYVMQGHPLAGANLAKEIWPECPDAVLELIRLHHERPGGGGYPYRIADPHPAAVLIAACDVYAACREEKPYRGALSHEEALREAAKFAPPALVSLLEKAASAVERSEWKGRLPSAPETFRPWSGGAEFWRRRL